MDRIKEPGVLKRLGAETAAIAPDGNFPDAFNVVTEPVEFASIGAITDFGAIPRQDESGRQRPGFGAPNEFVTGSPGAASSNPDLKQMGSEAGTEAAGSPTDTLFLGQYYLRNNAAGEKDLNIFRGDISVWDDYTGQGVNVGIIDDGIDKGHVDLDDNYNASLETVDGSHQAATDRHGTPVAGIIGAERNGVGTVGVAYDCSMTMMGPISASENIDIAGSLENSKKFDVVNNSWEFLSPYFSDSVYNSHYADIYAPMQDIYQLGRGGLGTVFVKAAGNGRDDVKLQNANFSNLNSYWGGITVAAVKRDGSVSEYSTEGACVLVSAFGGPLQGDILTTDRTGDAGYVDSGDSPYPDYTGGFAGTSAAAPMVTGVVALMLEANPGLGYRDVQDILSLTARHTGSAVGAGPSGAERYGWEFNHAAQWNGGGMHFSEDYGYGLVDALAAVRLAESWTETRINGNLAGISQSSITASGTTIADNSTLTVQFVVESGVAVEHALLSLGMSHTWVGDLTISLTSPSGTVSELLSRNGGDTDVPDYGVADIMLSSSMFRGEESGGIWILSISDGAIGDTGTLSAVGLQLLGSQSADPDDVHVLTEEYSDYATDGRRSLVDADGGQDTLNATAVFSDSVINLRSAANSSVDGVIFTTDGNIENVYSGDGADTLFGNALANLLHGGRGDDTLRGGGGNDSLIGGDGLDTVTYASAGGAAVSVNLAMGTASGHASDLLMAVENVIGSGRGDSISGDGAGNLLNGANGADTLEGSGGDDVLNGGRGADTATFASCTKGVTVDLGRADKQDTGAGEDILISIENLIGARKGDLLTGSKGENLIEGGAGADTLNGGGGRDELGGGVGVDRLTGGAGKDILSGGAQGDTFIYLGVGDSRGKARDVIVDLADADRIDLSAIDAKSAAGDQAFDLVDELTGVEGQMALVYDATQAQTALLLDINGDSKADMAIMIDGDHTAFANFVF